MIIAVGILAFMAICALSLVGLGESHSRVSRILNEMDDHRVHEEPQTEVPVIELQSPKMDVFAEVGFTRSLLALSKVRSLDPYEAPKLDHVESSSWVSVRRAQSKNHAQVF
jgi:hypothetical protein